MIPVNGDVDCLSKQSNNTTVTRQTKYANDKINEGVRKADLRGINISLIRTLKSSTARSSSDIVILLRSSSTRFDVRMD